MSSRARTAGIVGGAVGLAAAAVAVGVAVERYAIGRIRNGPDSEYEEPFGDLVADREREVATGDGLALHVEEDGPPDAPLTVVFVHGYCLSLGSWHYQRRGLADMGRIRMVFYDQRSHGRSERAPSDAASIDQLGADLYSVLREVAPRGPVVLVGHSMGGMTIMALADAHPELFGALPGSGPRIVGVALLSTSTGKLAEVTLGLPAVLTRVRAPIVPFITRNMRRRATLVERSRRIGGDIGYLLTRKYSFGSKDVSPSLVEYVGQLIAATPVEVIADYLPALTSHDKLAALEVLQSVETLIVVGEKDLMTPLDHSLEMSQAVPEAELVVIEGAGHLAMMERPALVNLRLRAFVHRAARSASSSRRRKA